MVPQPDLQEDCALTSGPVAPPQWYGPLLLQDSFRHTCHMLKIIKVHSRSISIAFCFCISKPYVLAHCIPSAFQKHFSFPLLRVLNAECFSEAFQFFVLGGCCIPSLCQIGNLTLPCAFLIQSTVFLDLILRFEG